MKRTVREIRTLHGGRMSSELVVYTGQAAGVIGAREGRENIKEDSSQFGESESSVHLVVCCPCCCYCSLKVQALTLEECFYFFF